MKMRNISNIAKQILEQCEDPTNIDEVTQACDDMIEKMIRDLMDEIRCSEPHDSTRGQLAYTVADMLYGDHLKRTIAEYNQGIIRRRELANMIYDWDRLTDHPGCGRAILIKQLDALDEYLSVLREHISIHKPDTFIEKK